MVVKNKRRNFIKKISALGLGIGTTTLMNGQESQDNGDSRDACNAMTEDYYGQGPFYTPNPPVLEEGQLALGNEVGQPLRIYGRVFNLACNESIANTKIDIWHANHDGDYDNEGFNLRGFTYSDGNGEYSFDTILPGKYLNGNQFRPSHIHFKITPPGFPEFITQLYFEGDDSIPIDAAASITTGQFDATNRIIPLQNENDILMGQWDIVIDGNGTPLSDSNFHLDKGILYDIYPNPFTDIVNIEYSTYINGESEIQICDARGKRIAILDEQDTVKGKYRTSWKVPEGLPSGTYFMILYINNLPAFRRSIIRL